MAVNLDKTTGRLAGPAGADYGTYGVGNTVVSYREVTRKGRWPNDNTGPNRSQGENPGVGSIYAAELVERPNLSNPRNRGPERVLSRAAMTPIGIVTHEQRNTGRI